MRAPGGTETWSFHREQAGDGRALPPGAARARLPAPPVRRPPAPRDDPADHGTEGHVSPHTPVFTCSVLAGAEQQGSQSSVAGISRT
jgi:hypothetical protein